MVSVPHDTERLKRALEPRYRVLDVIGRGAMSTVYLGWESALQREVAIKVLAPRFEVQLEDRERFRREARIAAALVHPNIVPVYAFDRREEVTFLTMPHVVGESLADRLLRELTLEPADARAVLMRLADALQYVHRRGIIHRDLKPSNVLLAQGVATPMLIDFGVATLTTSDHSRSELPKRFGTPHYMSPEQALGEANCDGRSDLYALGVMGFQMLTGRLPFEGTSPRQLTAQHVALTPPSITELAPRVPTHLAAVVERCLAKDPARRWPDGERLRAALHRQGRSRWHGWLARLVDGRGRRIRRARSHASGEAGAWAQQGTPSLA